MSAYDGNRIIAVNAVSLADNDISDDRSDARNIEARLKQFLTEFRVRNEFIYRYVVLVVHTQGNLCFFQ